MATRSGVQPRGAARPPHPVAPQSRKPLSPRPRKGIKTLAQLQNHGDSRSDRCDRTCDSRQRRADAAPARWRSREEQPCAPCCWRRAGASYTHSPTQAGAPPCVTLAHSLAFWCESTTERSGSPQLGSPRRQLPRPGPRPRRGCWLWRRVPVRVPALSVSAAPCGVGARTGCCKVQVSHRGLVVSTALELGGPNARATPAEEAAESA